MSETLETLGAKVDNLAGQVTVLRAVVIQLARVEEKIKPYICFDSKSQDSIDAWWSWMWKGFLGFVIFAIILGTTLKEYITNYIKSN